MKITGRTKVFGIFGDPVEHTVSPAMHNSAFEALNLDMVYVPFLVRGTPPPGGLKGAVEGMRAMNILGMNITIPHKERVIEYLDWTDEHASEIGAVNTVVNRDGTLVGYNTDGAGYMLSLREETGFIPEGKKAVIVGAGGAARAILFSILAGNPRTVVLANRSVERAKTLAGEFGKKFKGVDIRTSGLD